jgi:N-acetylmuramoyl-L-alanine amidase
MESPFSNSSPGALRKACTGLICLVLVVWTAGSRVEAATAQELYLEALARERAVRPALQSDSPPDDALRGVRSVIAAYQEVVRQYPRSGYSDNALWQAGCLALDAFLRFGQDRDRAAAERLLHLLTTEYPSSSRVRLVPGQLARLTEESRSESDGSAEAAASTVPDSATGAPARTRPPETARAGASISKPVRIRDIRREVLRDAVRITIELDSEVRFHDERLTGPVRVFVDLAPTQAAPALLEQTFRFDDSDIVRQIRIGRHPGSTTRIVLDAGGMSSYSVYPLYNPYRLVIDCFREQPKETPQETVRLEERPALAPPDAGPAALPSAPLPDNDRNADSVRAAETGEDAESVRDGESVRTASADPSAADDVEQASAPSRPPLVAEALPAVRSAPVSAAPVGGGYTMARQLGLSVSRIVIDPGHGGHDPGAKGRSITEAELVLDIALRVEKLLQNVPGMEVILTRRTDEYVSLQERTAIANREGADLFLSIHANASPNSSARGVETYFLNFASNMSAASVAARENAASGQAMGSLPDFLKAIALNNKLDESRGFASEVQKAMVERLRRTNRSLRDLGVKQAPFVVLIGAAMPSVLTEVSFVTNPQEARLLRGTAYRERIAEALVAAIRKYQSSLGTAATVAQQR